MTQLRSVQQPAGVYYVQPNSGTALETQFTVYLSAWTYNGLAHVPLMYYLAYSYTDANQNEVYTELLEIDNLVNVNLYNGTNLPLSYQLTFIAPEIGQDYTLTLILDVYDNFTTVESNLTVQVTDNALMNNLTLLLQFSQGSLSNVQALETAALTIQQLFQSPQIDRTLNA